MTNIRLRPSSSHRWLNCSGSVDLCKDIPETDSPMAARGREIHEEAEKITLNLLAKQTSFSVSSQIALLYSGYVVNSYHEMSLTDDVKLHTEVFLSDIEAEQLDYECSGTADTILECDKGLHIIDLKTGRTPIEVKNNPQLIIYGYLASKHFKKPVLSTTIFQMPYEQKDATISTEYFDSQDVFVKIEDEIKLIKRKLHAKVPDFRVGDWCTHCPARFECEALLKERLPQFKRLPAPTSITPLEAFKLSKFLNSYREKLNEYVDNCMLTLKLSEPGLKVVAKRPSRVMTKTDEEIAEDLYKLGFTPKQITRLKTLTDLEKLGKEVKKYIQENSAYVSSGQKVVFSTDEGDALDFMIGDNMSPMTIDQM